MNTQKENKCGKGLHYYGELHEIDGLINAAMPTISFSMVHATRKNKKFRRKLEQSHSLFQRLRTAGKISFTSQPK